MKTIACVLKTGVWTQPGHKDKKAEYTPADVRWLKRQAAPYCDRFVCLSDVEIEGVDTIRLRHNWPGWWSKMELFAHFDSAFYIDLDTVVVGDISDMVTPKNGFQCLRNLSSPKSGRIGSGLMRWRGDYSFLYEEFAKFADRHIGQFTTSEWWGDQGFIRSRLPEWDHLQDEFPGAIVSFNKDMNQRGDPPSGAKIVCFHGKVKPRAVQHRHEWIPA